MRLLGSTLELLVVIGQWVYGAGFGESDRPAYLRGVEPSVV